MMEIVIAIINGRSMVWRVINGCNRNQNYGNNGSLDGNDSDDKIEKKNITGG